ncbi:MAG TPA: ATP-binding protein, partial [Rhodanobacteraceae bacterium]|nr:ATP-binding protein [Rhodanobacteraceae bacterium]
QGGGEMGARMRRHDWASTSLGPAALWPQSLKTIVRVMLDSRYAMWMLWGPDITFFCNDAYLPTVGIKRDWVLGARADKVWEEVWPDIGPRIEHVLQRGAATWDEALLLFLERSGFTEETYHTFSYSPVYDDTSRVAGMLCVVTEVTERVIGERRLRMLSQLAARLAGVGTVEACCREACEALSQYPLDIPFAALYLATENGREVRNVTFVSGADASLMPDTLSIDDAQPWPVAALYRTETAQEVRGLSGLGIDITAGAWLDLVERALLLPLKTSTHGLSGFLVAGCSPRRPFDIDYASFLNLVAAQVGAAIAGAQAYDGERRRAESLAELDRAKTAFFSNVSHEFRTPLTLMLGPLRDIVADSTLPAATRARLALAERNAARLQRLVNSLLDFSRIEAGRTQARYEPTDLATLTRDIASTFRSAMEKAGLAFDVCCGTLDQPVYVDHEMWEKIVLNLLSNAFKFTLAGRVEVVLRDGGDSALLEIVDSGVGIPPAELPRLFERFHRIESTAGRTHEGSGIGLALVQELVKLHDGSIDAASAVGEGTTLRVRIPYGARHLPPERVEEASRRSPGVAASSSFVDEALRWLPDEHDRVDASEPMPFDRAAVLGSRFAATFGARIVLADDNSDMRAYLGDLLATHYNVETASDGEQALAATRRELPDLIVSDVMMPRLDGFGLLAAVRADATLRGVPVVLLSARAGEESRIEGLDAGADDYVIKPFSARELLARIGALLELRRVRQSAEQAARLRTAQFETLLNESPLGVFLLDAEFRLREANPPARARFASVPDFMGRDFSEIVRLTTPPPFAGEIIARFRATLEAGEPYFEAERAGTWLGRSENEYYEWRIHRIPLPDGRDGVVCYFRDVSAPVRARLQLETADRHKDEFLAMLAHELRNPLAPIRNAGEVLARLRLDDARAERAIGVVQRQISALTRLVDDLLDVSRITRGRIDLKRRPVELSDVVSQAVEMVEPLIREKAQRLSTTIERTLRVDGDPARLVQCVANILTNAAKYTDRGGSIRLETREEDGQALVAVSDNGIGIPAELQPRVFDLFVQGERTLDRSQGGLGIGLSVVKRLIEMHGGNILVVSEGPGRGSCFEFRLPLIERGATPMAPPPAITVTPRRILVVDDNEDAANSLTMVLSFDGHEVECAYDAEEALERAQSFKPDIALLDVGLPRMSGYELAERLRALPGFADIYLVALTGYGQAEDKARALAAGFDGHLVKPAEFRALQEILERMPR